MEEWIKEIIAKVEPLPDSIYGPRYRCALTLKDGTFIPCAVLQSKKHITELAKRRIKQEMSGTGIIGGPDPYGQIVSNFAARGNRINDYDVKSSSLSKFAPPIALAYQIHGETTMGWTGWVFEMKDGKHFPYGSSFNMEFLDLPEGYAFDDVLTVHNHCFITKEGTMASLERGDRLPPTYEDVRLYRERVFFCVLHRWDMTRPLVILESRCLILNSRLNGGVWIEATPASRRLGWSCLA